MKILIVEDEVRLAEATAAMLRQNAYTVDLAFDGETGSEKAASGIYDLVILDVMLPKKDGFEILEDVRALAPETRVIMLTARGELSDKLAGLKNGADDYMTKPFHMEELLARVDIQLKKSSAVQSNKLEYGDIYLDLKSGMLVGKESGENIPIAGKEYALLEYFLSHPGQILTRDQLYSKVWGWDNTIESNNLEAYLSFLRKKLRLLGSKVEIRSVRGLGYRIGVKDA
ncbi:response regulator transcription factor [Allobaculum mucilyticum]|uniref:response regulator transcription factor n=1 Tax=Allobaculum mucilyticum TaxID=2834459 RepID=UPI001E46C70D|nr:response regulator transcription factor [Allobaculum mucilyticum]UNT95430.1 response regulator transcription factor [Allobaculum mucilyticum]